MKAEGFHSLMGFWRLSFFLFLQTSVVKLFSFRLLLRLPTLRKKLLREREFQSAGTSVTYTLATGDLFKRRRLFGAEERIRTPDDYR